jgi:hypothetical protein
MTFAPLSATEGGAPLSGEVTFPPITHQSARGLFASIPAPFHSHGVRRLVFVANVVREHC